LTRWQAPHPQQASSLPGPDRAQVDKYMQEQRALMSQMLDMARTQQERYERLEKVSHAKKAAIM
jgi:hypothetical protein